MILSRIIIFIFVLLCLCGTSGAFEDTFQYYNGIDANFLENFGYSTSYSSAAHTSYTLSIVDDGAATYSRGVNVQATVLGDSFSYNVWRDFELYTLTQTSSSYWSFNIRDYYIYDGDGGVFYFKVKFYDDDEVYIGMADLTSYLTSDKIGLYELSLTSSQVSLRLNGVNEGVVGSASDSIAHLGFYVYAASGGGHINHAGDITRVYIDDISTGGNVVGVCSEPYTHTITESNLNPMNISYSINTFPFATYTSTEYKVQVKRYEEGTLTEVVSETVKASGNSSVFSGFSNYNRSVDLTDSDTAYGLYTVYLTGNGVSKDTDYFFFAPPGDVSSISFSNPEIPIGTSETITYSIDTADFGTYSYHVRVYSTTAQVFFTQVIDASSTVSWDTTGETTGLYFVVLSRTDKSSGAYIELIYDIATLSNNIVIRGHIYDAQNETVLDNVSVNFSQASTWYNTTSNATGYYELSGLIATVEINVNASLVNYTHENFTFTPLTAEIYTVDLYLINSTPTYDNTTIGGLTYDYPLHQAVINSTVNIYNATWSNTTTSSLITGFYLFEELTNGSYTVNATKTDYQDSDEYSVDTNNESWRTQNILMYGIYDLTIKAQDSTTHAYLSTFSILFEDDVYTTTNGTVVLIDLTYDLYSVCVSAENYYASAEDILVDETKTEVISMTQTSSEYYVEHFVEFVVRNVWNTVYPDVDVTVYEGSSTTDYKSGTTGSNGAVTFQLSEDIEYRLTFISTDLGIDEEITLYPIELRYYVYVDAYSFNPPNTTTDDITATITSSRINSTHGYINFSWSDPGALTSSIEYSISDVDGNELYNTSNSGPDMTDSQIVAAVDVRYIVHYTGIHPTHGTINHVQTVVFYGGRMVDLGWTEEWQYAVTSFSFIIFIGALFGARTAHYGAIAVVMVAWFFMWIGWLNATNTSLTLIILATIVAFGYAMRKGEEVKQ